MVIVSLLLLGLCFGSFVNALVWRTHKQLNEKSSKNRQKYSIVKGRSMCSVCGHALAAKDLIPVVSWLSLRGRCRYCHKPIPDTPLAELLVPILFILLYIFWPQDIAGGQWLLFAFWLSYSVLLVALGLYDFKWQLLPDRLVAVLGILVTVQIVLQAIFYNLPLSSVVQAIFGAIVGGGVFYVLFQVSSGRWIGGGDVKLGFVLGLMLGSPAKALLLIFAASLLGTLVAAPSLVSKRMQATSKLPFGPYLISAALFTFVFGQAIIDWYMRFSGL